jgi:hypothetical protein
MALDKDPQHAVPQFRTMILAIFTIAIAESLAFIAMFESDVPSESKGSSPTSLFQKD